MASTNRWLVPVPTTQASTGPNPVIISYRHTKGHNPLSRGGRDPACFCYLPHGSPLSPKPSHPHPRASHSPATSTGLGLHNNHWAKASPVWFENWTEFTASISKPNTCRDREGCEVAGWLPGHCGWHRDREGREGARLPPRAPWLVQDCRLSLGKGRAYSLWWGKHAVWAAGSQEAPAWPGAPEASGHPAMWEHQELANPDQAWAARLTTLLHGSCLTEQPERGTVTPRAPEDTTGAHRQAGARLPS